MEFYNLKNLDIYAIFIILSIFGSIEISNGLYGIKSKRSQIKIANSSHLKRNKVLLKFSELIEIKKDDLIDRCVFATRQLAKRQFTWMKNFSYETEIEISSTKNILKKIEKNLHLEKLM